MTAATDCRYACGCILRVSFSAPKQLPCMVAHVRLMQVKKEHKPYYTPFLIENAGPCPACANKKRVTPLKGLPIFEA